MSDYTIIADDEASLLAGLAEMSLIDEAGQIASGDGFALSVFGQVTEGGQWDKDGTATEAPTISIPFGAALRWWHYQSIPTVPAQLTVREKLATDPGFSGTAPQIIADPLILAKKNGKIAVIEFATKIGAQLTGGYPRIEREAWITKLAEAKAIVAGETNPDAYPVIAAEISVTGVAPADLAQIIIGKARLFEAASGLISGLRQVTISAIDAANDQAEIDDILSSAEQSALSLLADLLDE